MQTFLPLANFAASAQVLDSQRLGKQRSEAKQIYKALQDSSSGWARHPATLMWAGYEPALALYGVTICAVWVGRGYHDEQLQWFAERLPKQQIVVMPPWWGDQRFHSSHRSKLFYKNKEFYGQYDWWEATQPPRDYFWPTKEGYGQPKIQRELPAV